VRFDRSCVLDAILVVVLSARRGWVVWKVGFWRSIRGEIVRRDLVVERDLGGRKRNMVDGGILGDSRDGFIEIGKCR